MTVIKLRGGTAAEWTTINPILAVRELGLETDTRKAKIGDGVTVWNSLLYAFPSVGGGAVSSVFGRIGDVVALQADYSAFYSLIAHNHDATYAPISHAHAASVITNVPAGGISATDVQAAINELDTEKSATIHNHDSSYSAIGHNHDGSYSLLGHTHTASEVTDFNAAADARPLSSHAAASANVLFGGQQAIDFRIENRTSDPGSPTVGQIWLRTDL